jgi:hypothetical protein
MHKMYFGIEVEPKNEAFAAQDIYCYFLDETALPPPANCSKESTTTIARRVLQLGTELPFDAKSSPLRLQQARQPRQLQQ